MKLKYAFPLALLVLAVVVFYMAYKAKQKANTMINTRMPNNRMYTD